MTNQKQVSIGTVITSFNRIHCVGRAIESALLNFPSSPVVLVDDASQDGTVEHVLELYSGQIESNQLKVIALQKNLGVTGAKNQGYLWLNVDWVIFLDSDDCFLPSIGRHIEAELGASKLAPIVFFRCQDHFGQFVGRRQGERCSLDLSNYLCEGSYGEALTVINKGLIGSEPPYVEELRGHEAIGCCRVISKFGPALLSSIVAREYNTDGNDRLSVSRGFFLRLPLIARGHLMLLSEFWRYMTPKRRISLLAKAIIYMTAGRLYFLCPK